MLNPHYSDGKVNHTQEKSRETGEMPLDPWKQQPPSNIIIRMPDWLGDVIMATPILGDIREKWPDATITAMCQSQHAPVLENDPNLNEVFAFHQISGWLRRQENRDVIRKLRDGNYDLGVLLTHSFSSAWWFWRGNVRTRVGFVGNFRSRLLSHPVQWPQKIDRMHQVNIYKRLVRRIAVHQSKNGPRVTVAGKDMELAQRHFDALGVTEHHTVIGVCPGASFGSAKKWPADNYRELIERLLEEDPLIRVIVFGDTGSVETARQVCGDQLPDRVVNLAGKASLSESMAMIRLCQVFVTNDSGPMHLAAALRTPLVAIFGPTDPTRAAPFEWGNILYKGAECSPCHKRECPIDHHCMTQITVDEVYQAVLKQKQKVFEFPGR